MGWMIHLNITVVMTMVLTFCTWMMSITEISEPIMVIEFSENFPYLLTFLICIVIHTILIFR